MTLPRNLATAFLQSSERFADNAALSVGGQERSYEDLARRAMSLAATVRRPSPSTEVPLTAILAYRSETAYVGILGALLAGHGYVPLNPTFPIDRTRLMLERSKCRSLIVDARSKPQLEKLLADVSLPLVIICPDQTDTAELGEKLPKKHRVVGAAELADADHSQGAWRRVVVALPSVLRSHLPQAA